MNNKCPHYSSDMLWMAPEHLRQRETIPERAIGSQKGDIYSFAIIVSEIMSKNTPYGDVNCSAKGTVNRRYRLYPYTLDRVVRS